MNFTGVHLFFESVKTRDIALGHDFKDHWCVFIIGDHGRVFGNKAIRFKLAIHPLETACAHADRRISAFGFHIDHAILFHWRAQPVLRHPDDHLGTALMVLKLLGNQASLALHRPLCVHGHPVVFGANDRNNTRIVFAGKDHALPAVLRADRSPILQGPRFCHRRSHDEGGIAVAVAQNTTPISSHPGRHFCCSNLQRAPRFSQTLGALPHLVASSSCHVDCDIGHHGWWSVVAEGRVHVMTINSRLLADAKVEPGQRRIAMLPVLLKSFPEIDARPPTTLNAVNLFLRPIGKIKIEQQPGRPSYLRVTKVVEIVEPLDQCAVIAVAHHFDAQAFARTFTAVNHKIRIPGPIMFRRRSAVIIFEIPVFGPILRDPGKLPADRKTHGVMIL